MVTPDDQSRLLAQLKVDEDCKLYAYADSEGWLTLGYGRLVDWRKGGQISLAEAEYLLNNDIARTEKELAAYAWFTSQDSVRQAALTDMAFNLGTVGLLHFPHFLGYMIAKDYANAVKELKDTPWHSQVGVRADRIIVMIEKGAWA
jgi:GH24 family phage-related lysozyme (muramidase)